MLKDCVSGARLLRGDSTIRGDSSGWGGLLERGVVGLFTTVVSAGTRAGEDSLAAVLCRGRRERGGRERREGE